MDIFINVCEREILIFEYLNFSLSIDRYFKFWERLWIYTERIFVFILKVRICIVGLKSLGGSRDINIISV